MYMLQREKNREREKKKRKSESVTHKEVNYFTPYFNRFHISNPLSFFANTCT